MEKGKLVLTLILFELTFHQGKALMNITYYREGKSWKEAAQFCLTNGGILESSIGNITNQFNYDGNGIWVGQYESLTPWKAVWGCFKIKSYLRRFEIDLYDSLVCQNLCKESEFFSVKETECICLSSDMVTTPLVHFLPCNCRNCFHVMKQNINILTDVNDNNECLAVDCPNGYLHYLPARCNNKFFLICDNGYRFNYTYHTSAQQTECYGQRSFIKWYKTCSEGDGNLSAQHWTSATRTIYQFILTEEDDIIKINPTMCMKQQKTANGLSSMFASDCSDKLPFFCKFNMFEIGHTNGEETKNYSGLIIGCVLSVIVFATLFLAVVVYRRRAMSKSPDSRDCYGRDNYSTDNQQNNYTRDSVVSNPNYSIPHPLLTDGILTDDYDYPPGNRDVYDKMNASDKQKQDRVNAYDNPKNLTHVNGNYNDDDIIHGTKASGRNEHRLENTKTEANIDSSFSKPMNEEESDPYTSNKDYDRLNNVKKKQNPNHKVYDHLPVFKESDPTYDHAILNISTKSNGDYDHFSVKY